LYPPQEKGEGKSMSEQEYNGLTLEGLAQRLEALEHENAELRSRVATLEGSGTRRDELAENRGSDTRRSEEAAFDGQVSRRSLFSKAVAAAVAATAAGTLLNTREAKAHRAGDGDIFADRVFAHFVEGKPHNTTTTPILGETASTYSAILGHNFGSGAGVSGDADGVGPGVKGRGGTGVRGEGDGEAGVYGEHIAKGPGVVGKGVIGVRGHSSTSGQAGVYGANTAGTGPGLVGDGDTGVWGRSPKTGMSGVTGEHTGSSGYGVVGDGKGSHAGVLGRNPNGYGGQFDGGKAQLKLNPKGTTGKPKGIHSKGELYLDSNATLFVCTASGAPGTWRQVTTTAA
jgi:hypothetical protein